MSLERSSIAPELIAGRPADVASDLYAFGATLYEMITGHVPFSDFDEQRILSQHLEESVMPPSHSRPDVPSVLEAIVLRLLAKNPNDRFASAQEVCNALEQVTLTSNNGIARTNLPELSGTFIEHGNDITQVKALLESSPLVTLLGDDEMLAIATGKQLLHEFSDGVWWVDLGGLNNPALVAETVAASLGIGKDTRRSLIVSLIEYLREKNLLLILNHCDHVLEACTQLAETVLRVCPDVQILAVSHELLNVAGEVSY
jgi:non-specific serine/threonine protein kinase